MNGVSATPTQWRLSFPAVLRLSAAATLLATNGLHATQHSFVNTGMSFEGVHSGCIAWGDFDGDTNQDVFVSGVTAAGTPTSLVYRNLGGSFSNLRAGIMRVKDGDAAWADYDLDGDLDLAVAGWKQEIGFPPKRDAALYRNDNGVFRATSDKLLKVDLCSLAWGDHDGDGKPDLFISGRTNDLPDKVACQLYHSVYSNGTHHLVSAKLSSQDVTPLCEGAVKMGDFTGDGRADVLLSGREVSYPGEWTLYRSNGTNSPSPPLSAVTFSAGYFGAKGDVAIGDIDDDGDLDAVATGVEGFLGTSEQTSFLRNNGSGVLSTLGTVILPGVAFGSVDLADFDGDGDLDVAIAGDTDPTKPGGEIAAIYVNNGITFSNLNANLEPVSNADIQWGDYDGDGFPDLMLCGKTGSGQVITRLYRNAPPDLDADDDGLNDDDEVTYGTDPKNPDTDGDGLTDGQEVFTYGTVPTDPDTDDDGQNDGDEVIAGTSPQNSRSRFALTDITVDPTRVYLEWDAAAGRVYTVQRASTIGGWNDLIPLISNRQGKVTFEALPGASHYFYRVMVEGPAP